MTQCNYCGELSVKNVCTSPQCQAKLDECKNENKKREEYLKNTKDRSVPGFFGGLCSVRAMRYYDEAHDDGIVYRHYLKENKEQGCISSGLSRFELKKRYQDWLND